MKKSFLLFSFLIAGVVGFAQNKTLGVGVATPNPNAALHVESPTNNQGFIMPRLTTAQRLAMSLSASDIGLMVYDTDLLGVYTWEGAQWDEDQSVSATITSTTGNAGYFAINNAGNTGAALYATTNGVGGPTSAAIIGETASAFSAITGIASGPNGSNAVSGMTSCADPFSFGVYGNATGGGVGGMFQINNAASTNFALQAETNGTGGAAKFKVTNAASVTPALWAETNSNQALSAPIYGLNTGTGDAAGVFRINNAASAFEGVFAETNGTGTAVLGNQTGTGRAGSFQILNASNTQIALRATTTGTGKAGHFQISNTSAVDNAALYATTNSTGTNSAAIRAEHNGGFGYSGLFQNINPANNTASLFASTASNGPAFHADTNQGGDAIEAIVFGTGTGSAGLFEISNVANTSSALRAETSGSGAAIYALNTGTANGFAGSFENTQASNTYPAVQAKARGTGSAIRAIQPAAEGTGPGIDVHMLNPTSNGAGVMVQDQGLGDAGNFTINNGSNTSAVLRATTNGTGTAIFANHTGASGNIAIFQSSSANVARIAKNGQGFFNGGTVNSGADVAEMFDVEGGKNDYEPGDVLIISESTDRTVEKSNAPNSTKVAGVYATKPGVLLTEKSIEENLDELVPMGVVGVIPTKVCLENGPIKRGDLLVTSSTKGHAMKAVPVIINGVEIYPTGAILGKALENFESGDKGLIKVLVNVK